MPRNSKNEDGALHSARPTSGDLVDRFLEGKLRAVLFGAEEELHLGRLRIEGSLGRGGMGAILSAFDPVLDRHVAIKSLLPDLSEDRDVLLREARMLAKLDHANVVSIYDVVEDDDGLYLVMEQVEGGDLRSWMSGKHSPQEVVDVFVQLGKGLAAAHELGIAHCDVKPDNVVISEGRPRLIDFGLAHQRSDAPSHAGTKAYLAPERVAGAPGSAAADQYAFFASLVEAIEGKRPAREERWQRLPAWLTKVVRRGMHDDPARRFPDMNAALSALQPRSVRTKAIAAAGVLLLAGVGVGVALGGTDDNQVCRGAEQQLDESWTSVARESMAKSFTATSVTNAAGIWDRVEHDLDSYAADWIKLRTQSCLATRVHKEQSAALMDFSMHCFDRRLLAFSAVAKLFGEPDAKVVENAIKTVARLEGLEACVDPVALEQAVPLPASAAEQQELRRLQERFEDVRNLERRGKHAEALSATNTLVDQARALKYSPLTAEILLARGALQVTTSQLNEAEATFREAASAAARARDDKKVAEVWTRVLGLLARQGRYDEALTLEAVALTSAERVANDFEVQGRLQNTLGGIFLAKARYKDAYGAYKKALEMQRKIGAKDNEALAPAIANFGLAKWYTGDIKGAMADLQEALAMSLDALGPDHSRVAYYRQNIADLHRHLGEPEKAAPHYAEVLRIWKATLGPEHPNLAYPLEQLAMLAQGRGELDKARAYIDEALRLREAALGAEHPLVLQSLNVLAEIDLAKGSKESLARAQDTIEREVVMVAKLGDAGRRYAVYAYEARGKLAELRGDWNSSLNDRRLVLKLRLDTLGAEHRDTAFSYGQIGLTLLAMGRLAAADKNLVKAQKTYELAVGPNASDTIAMIQARGELERHRRKYKAAIALFEEAEARAKTAGVARLYEIRFALARTRFAAGDLRRARVDMRTLRTALPARQSALAKTIDAWLEKK